MKKFLSSLSIISILILCCHSNVSHSVSNNNNSLNYCFSLVKSIGDYYHLKVNTSEVINVSSKDVNEEIKSRLSIYSYEKEVNNRGIRNEDIIKIKYTVKFGSKKYDIENAHESEIIVGNSGFWDDFDKQLLGRKKNEQFQIKSLVPNNYEILELRKKSAIFNIKIVSIYETIYPLLTNEFLNKNYNCSNVKSFKNKVKNDIYMIKYNDYILKEKESLLNEVILNTTFDKSIKNLYNDKEKELYDNYYSYAMLYNLTLDETLAQFNLDRKDIKSNAKELINSELVVKYLVETENLNLDKKEYIEKALTIVDSYGYDKIDDFISDNGEDYLYYELYKAVVLDFLYDINVKD